MTTAFVDGINCRKAFSAQIAKYCHYTLFFSGCSEASRGPFFNTPDNQPDHQNIWMTVHFCTGSVEFLYITAFILFCDNTVLMVWLVYWV